MYALQSPKDSRDWSFEGLSCGDVSALPDQYSLLQYALPARNQGPRSTCVAFVGSTICEVLNARATGHHERFSPEFIYQMRDNMPSTGMYGRNLFKILHKIGNVPEHHYPYADSDDSVHPIDDSLLDIAAEHKISAYAKVKTIEGLKRAIYEVGPAYLLLPLYETRPKFWVKTDETVADLPPGHRPSMSSVTGSHAVAVIGYNYEGFILQNSWGPEWNNAGTIVLKFKYWPRIIECWVPFRVITYRPERRFSDSGADSHIFAGAANQNVANQNAEQEPANSRGDKKCCNIL